MTQAFYATWTDKLNALQGREPDDDFSDPYWGGLSSVTAYIHQCPRHKSHHWIAKSPEPDACPKCSEKARKARAESVY